MMIKKISFAMLMTTILYATSCPYQEEEERQSRGVPIVGVLVGLGWTYSSYLNALGPNDPLYSGGPSALGKCI